MLLSLISVEHRYTTYKWNEGTECNVVIFNKVNSLNILDISEEHRILYLILYTLNKKDNVNVLVVIVLFSYQSLYYSSS